MRFENIILDILRVLPKSVLKLIAGPLLVIDGNQLDLNIQVVKIGAILRYDLIKPASFCWRWSKISQVTLKQ